MVCPIGHPNIGSRSDSLKASVASCPLSCDSRDGAKKSILAAHRYPFLRPKSGDQGRGR